MYFLVVEYWMIESGVGQSEPGSATCVLTCERGGNHCHEVGARQAVEDQTVLCYKTSLVLLPVLKNLINEIFQIWEVSFVLKNMHIFFIGSSCMERIINLKKLQNIESRRNKNVYPSQRAHHNSKWILEQIWFFSVPSALRLTVACYLHYCWRGNRRSRGVLRMRVGGPGSGTGGRAPSGAVGCAGTSSASRKYNNFFFYI